MTDSHPNYCYVMATVDITSCGLNVSAWMCPEPFYASELKHYPHEYQYIGGFANWKVSCNMELTPALITAIGETADKLCTETHTRNQKRKIANR